MVAPRSRPIVRWRLGLTVLFLVAVGIGLGTCPIPLIHWAAFAIEPQGARRVMTQLPGELIELKVQPGDHVVAGQLLATFQNAELEDRLRELTVKRSLQEKAIQLAMTLDSPSDRVLAEEGLHTVQQQIDELSEQIRQLTITAPVAGTVVAPPRQLPPTLAQSKTRLGHWYGTPLDEKNMGCFLQERTHLLTIAPSDAMQATLYLDQADRHEVKPGLSVRLMFDHLPGQVFHGEVSQVAEAHTDTAPQQLSVKHGGQLSTVTDREGNEQLPDAAYQATVLLSEAPGLLKSNLRGNARFVATRRSAFSWFWRFFRRTFHFRM